ncbi:MAG: hypothetical protein EBX40_03410 [Gammaproteobacteria bacterium]|nr:hypothetical protein [Gammaproteobacteria bacterium]
MKIKNIVASLLQVLLVPAASASITLIPDDSPLRSQSMLFRVNYQEWNMPVGYQTMGVVTTEGLFEVTPNWYGGFGLGGAVKGGNGGFFMLNFTGGYQHKIVGPLWMDLAANIGAGGGHTTPVGGGLFYEPEATLSYHLKWVNLGLGYSYVKFPQGDIRSHQAVFTVDVPFGLNAASASVEGDPLITDDTPVHFGHNRLSLIGDLAFPRAGSKDTQGQPERGRVALMGVEFAHFLPGLNSNAWADFLSSNSTGCLTKPKQALGCHKYQFLLDYYSQARISSEHSLAYHMLSS